LAQRPTPTARKVRKHRARLREDGLRPVQFWVPDTRGQGFSEEAHRQSLAVSRSTRAKDDQAFIDSICEFPEP